MLDEGLIVARRISKHATRISLISDAGTKHVDTLPTRGVAYGSLSMTNVSNALIRKIKNEDVHGTRYRDEAHLDQGNCCLEPRISETLSEARSRLRHRRFCDHKLEKCSLMLRLIYNSSI